MFALTIILSTLTAAGLVDPLSGFVIKNGGAPTIAVQLIPVRVVNVAPGPVQPINDDEKLICKRQDVIGSLIKSKRVCATRRIWEANSRVAQDQLQTFTASGAFSPNGPDGASTAVQGAGADPFQGPR